MAYAASENRDRPKLLYGLNNKLLKSIEHFPTGIQSILESGIATGSICALGLHIIVLQTEFKPEVVLAEVRENMAAEIK